MWMVMYRIAFERLYGIEPVDVQDLQDLKAHLRKRGACCFLLKLVSHQDVVEYHSKDWTSVDDLNPEDLVWLTQDMKYVFKSILYATPLDGVSPRPKDPSRNPLLS